jgi:glucose-6-phosphate isomerase
LLKKDIEEKYGKAEAVSRIIAVTDASKGALRKLATSEGYKTFVIPDDVGGRYSVLTPVGLIAISAAGFDIRSLVAGAVDMENQTAPEVKFPENLAALYAAIRNELYRNGYIAEIMVNYNPKLHFLLNGGSNCMVKVKARRERESSRQASILLPICTPWDSISRKVNASFLKR